MVSDLFDPGVWDFTIGIQNISTAKNDVWVAISTVWKLGANQLPAAFLESISLMDAAAADTRAIQPTEASQGFWMYLDPGASAEVSFHVMLGQSAFLYLSLLDDVGRTYLVTHGATLIEERTNSGQNTTYKSKVWRITNPNGAQQTTHLACVQGICTRVPGSDPDSCSPEGSACTIQPGGEVPPGGTQPNMGPDIIECVFPEMSLNFISVMSGLASWLGCMIRNIIVLIKWIVDWIIHFPDHLDAWISRLFGVDPSLPFFDEVLKKIDIWISGKFGVDPEKPFWEELVKKALEWLGLSLDTAAENRIRERKW